MTTTAERPTTTDAADLRERLGTDDAPRLLDVRTAAEFETVHIPGSYNVPLDTLKEHRGEIAAHLDDEVVLVCRSGQRSALAEKALAAAGLPHVTVLDGGMLAWERTGGPVNRGRERWELERQVRLVAGSIVLGSVLASVVAPAAKWLAAGVGGGLTFAALSNSCAMGAALSKLPYNRDASVDPEQAVAALLGRAPR